MTNNARFQQETRVWEAKNQISIGRFGKQNLQFSYFFLTSEGRAKKMAHVREYRQESSRERPSSWTNFSSRDRTFLGESGRSPSSEELFSSFTPSKGICKYFFRIVISTLVKFSL